METNKSRSPRGVLKPCQNPVKHLRSSSCKLCELPSTVNCFHESPISDVGRVLNTPVLQIQVLRSHLEISASSSRHRYWNCKIIFLPFNVLIFAFRSFLWSKTRLPGSSSRCLVQLFCREPVSTRFWRKELHSRRYLRNCSCSLSVCIFLVRNLVGDHFLEVFYMFQNTFKKFS